MYKWFYNILAISSGHVEEVTCRLDCRPLTSNNYLELLWTTAAEFPGNYFWLLQDINKMYCKWPLHLWYALISSCRAAGDLLYYRHHWQKTKLCINVRIIFYSNRPCSRMPRTVSRSITVYIVHLKSLLWSTTVYIVHSKSVL